MTTKPTAREENIELFDKTTFDELFFGWENEAGSPIPLNDYTGLMSIKNEAGEEVASLSSTTGSGSRLVKDNAAGTLQIVLTPNSFPPLVPGNYTYDVIVYKTGETRRLAYGTIKVLAVRTVAP